MIYPFEFHRPSTVKEACALMNDLPAAALICGGTELLQVMKMGLARFEHLVDLKSIPTMRGIQRLDDGALRIGAATTHREVEHSEDVARTYPAVSLMEREIANQRVRNVGTIGGNLAFAEPHSDPATLLLALGARLEVESAEGHRELGIEDLVLDALTTALEPDEVLVAIRLPVLGADEHLVYKRAAFVERPTASVGCRINFSGGLVKDARVAVGSIGEVPVLVPSAAGVLVGSSADELETAGDRAAEAIRDECEASDDVGGSAEYKRHLAATLLRRALRQVVEESRSAKN